MTNETSGTQRNAITERVNDALRAVARWYHDELAYHGRHVAIEAYRESVICHNQTRRDELIAESERGSQMANKHWNLARKYDPQGGNRK